ncbi:Protein kinase domain-containing protein [Aphelenchoides besseyi]|nr:Protein kinase domain-containing protein [Aphelenchoides besseyi]
MPTETVNPTVSETRHDRLPIVGEVVRSESNRSYALKSILGEGGYGQVFEAQDEASRVNSSTIRTFALKAEKWSKTVLKIEISVLKAINQRNSKHFCLLTDFGRVTNEYFFIVLSLLGPDLAKLRNEMPDRHFTLGTAIRVGMQTSSAIEELHKAGFISRDVKPGNFAIGNKQEDLHRVVFMFDFGLSRRYVDKNANILPLRRDPGWRGTTRYGSLQAHLKQDLGRKDDYESWLYMLVEITKGSLPWRLVTDRLRVQEAKQNARTAGRIEFFSGCPQKFNQLLTTIDGLTFEAQPPYEQILKLLLEICQDHGISMTQKFDWETENTSSIHTSATRSIDKSPSDQQKANNVERPTNLHV